MAEATENLVLEHLRAIRQDIGDMKAGMREIRTEIMNLRQQLHIIQGDGLRQEQIIASVSLDVDRIKTRLTLNDA